MSNIFQSLWIGGKLSTLEHLCLKTFVDHGLPIHLYTYEVVDNVPDGVVRKDANDIVPESEIYRYKNGSLSAFSNYFRFMMLYKIGGYWVDADFACINPEVATKQLNSMDFVFLSEPLDNYIDTIAGSALLKMPAGSDIARKAVEIQKKHKDDILSGKMQWGSGPITMQQITSDPEMKKYLLDWKVCCTCRYYHAESLVNPRKTYHPSVIKYLSDLPESCFGIHMWNNVWSEQGINKDQSYEEDSIYELLKKQHRVPAPEHRRLNIIYFVDRLTYLTKLARERFHSVGKLAQYATLKFWGNGWDGYDEAKTVQENLDTLPLKFDLSISYKPLGLKNYKDINIPKCIQYNEMHDIHGTLREIQESETGLVICHHLNDKELYQKWFQLPGVQYHYIGHCAEKTIFKNYGLPMKYDILLIGNIHPSYPLRHRFHKLLPKLQMSGFKCHIHPHPGYDLTDAHTDRYLYEMAIVINTAKIVLTDSGFPRSRYGKYVEIPMCGSAAICANLPHDNADDYSYVIRVENEMSDQQIIDTLAHYLRNEDKRLEKVAKGVEFSKHYSHEHYAYRFHEIIHSYLRAFNL